VRRTDGGLYNESCEKAPVVSNVMLLLPKKLLSSRKKESDAKPAMAQGAHIKR